MPPAGGAQTVLAGSEPRLSGSARDIPSRSKSIPNRIKGDVALQVLFSLDRKVLNVSPGDLLQMKEGLQHSQRDAHDEKRGQYHGPHGKSDYVGRVEADF